jgi:hypothetical protein
MKKKLKGFGSEILKFCYNSMALVRMIPCPEVYSKTYRRYGKTDFIFGFYTRKHIRKVYFNIHI